MVAPGKNAGAFATRGIAKNNPIFFIIRPRERRMMKKSRHATMSLREKATADVRRLHLKCFQESPSYDRSGVQRANFSGKSRSEMATIIF
jgi:hypothetical protein